MNKLITKERIPLLLFLLSHFCFSQNGETINTLFYQSFDEYPSYLKGDLGMTYSQRNTIVKLWSPNVEEVKINLYDKGDGDNLLFTKSLVIDKKNGVWEIELQGDFHNKYYTLQAKSKGIWSKEMPDPYAKGVGVNGNRALIFDASKTNPANWQNDKQPILKSFSDVILYETHIRDFSIDVSSGIKNKGKYLAFTELNTKNNSGQSTGVDHLKEMGITHLHLLPAFDFKSIDETNLDKPQYNWGYDPQNYNAPEGSFSTNPFDGLVRINEFKQMVQSLHQANIRVVMDVVYNHTSSTDIFDQLVPGYYYRSWPDGKRSDATACGNEFASDRIMARQFMIESLKYWTIEYHIDGYRFDLMAIHDIETMNAISKALHQIDPTLFLYGEGWTAGSSPLAKEKQALKNNAKQLETIAVFSDDIRDGIKGHWSNIKEKGFVSGNADLKEVIKFGIVASTNHPQVNYDLKRSYAQFPYSDAPTKVIGYVSCHDNNTLYDKLKIANPTSTETEILAMDRLANTIVLTSQSVPFLQMGVEMKRDKKGVENSYNAPDSINRMDWNWKLTNSKQVSYYKQLIRLRKNHPAFKMPTENMIQKNLEFLDVKSPLLVGYTLKNNANGDKWKTIRVYFNGDDKEIIQKVEGKWILVCDGEQIDEKGLKVITTGIIKIPARAAIILHQD